MSALRKFLREVLGVDKSQEQKNPGPSGTAKGGDANQELAESDEQAAAAAQAGAAVALQALDDGAAPTPPDQAQTGAVQARPAGATSDDLLVGKNIQLEFVGRIVIVNRTGVILRNGGGDSVEPGTRFQTRPAKSIPPRQSNVFTVIGTSNAAGRVTWVPDGIQGAIWEIEYKVFPPGLLSPKLSTSVILNDNNRFTAEVDASNSIRSELRFILRDQGPPPPPQSFVSHVIINNDTDVVLNRSSFKPTAGVVETEPPQTIQARQQIEFQVRSEGALTDPNLQLVAGALQLTPTGQQAGEIWSLTFSANSIVDPTADSNIQSARFIADKAEIKAKNFKFNLRNQGTPPPPGPQSFVTHVFVKNATNVVLNHGPDSFNGGVFEAKPPDKIAPGDRVEFAVRSTDNGQGREVVSGSVVWRPDGAVAGEEWQIKFAESPRGQNATASQNIPSKQFTADDPKLSDGEFGVFEFLLRGNAQPPSANQFTSQVVVQNKTDVTLNLKPDPNLAAGTFTIQPPKSIAAGGKGPFAIKSETDPSDGIDKIAAAVIWVPDAPEQGEQWIISMNGTSQPKVSTAQQDLTSTRFTADQPVVNTDDFLFVINAEAEPEFKPPVEEKQPTLRLNDKSVDGWVEYLQERLNVRLKRKPNLKVDGTYGPITQKAVFDYQQQEHLQHDGTVGNETWASLRLAAPEQPGTDGREPHTFVDQGVKARWTSEGPGTFSTSADRLVLEVVSVGADTNLEGQKVSLFVTPPGGTRKGFFAKVSQPIRKTQTGQGDVHQVVVENLKKRFPSTPDQDITAYVIEGFFDAALGGDFFTSTKNSIQVVP